MNNDIAIRAEGLGKCFTLRHEAGGGRAGYRRLSEEIVEAVARPWRRLRRLAAGKETSAAGVPSRREQFWALKDVSFDVCRGEVVGIIGRNGAGKSTLLKVLSRITEPTEGRVRLRGRVASLLEVGTGFHPELTGRENIFLNGTILGMTRREIRRKFDEIVAFAEIEKFLDTPVKRYSSGMYVRLAFSVAAHLDPDILVVDEVLAVGDASFQKKCLGKMGEVSREQGRTVLFVSHNMPTLQTLCPRALWIEAGRVSRDGPAGEVIDGYLAGLSAAAGDSLGLRSADGSLVIDRVVTRDASGAECGAFRPGGAMTVDVEYTAAAPIERPCFWLAVNGAGGSLFGASMMLDGRGPGRIEGRGTVRAVFDSLPLMPQQTYTVMLGARREGGRTILIRGTDVGSLRIVASAAELGFDSEMADACMHDSAPVLVSYRWEFPGGGTAAVNPLREALKAQ